MKQIYNTNGLPTKIIERVGESDNKLVLFFTDKSFIILQGVYYGDIDIKVMDNSFSLIPTKSNLFELSEIGVISTEEFHKLNKQYTNDDIKQKEQKEYKQYKKLKIKYEK